MRLLPRFCRAALPVTLAVLCGVASAGQSRLEASLSSTKALYASTEVPTFNLTVRNRGATLIAIEANALAVLKLRSRTSPDQKWRTVKPTQEPADGILRTRPINVPASGEVTLEVAPCVRLPAPNAGLSLTACIVFEGARARAMWHTLSRPAEYQVSAKVLVADGSKVRKLRTTPTTFVLE